VRLVRMTSSEIIAVIVFVHVRVKTNRRSTNDIARSQFRVWLTTVVERERVTRRRGGTLERVLVASRGREDPPSCCDYGVGSDEGGACDAFKGKVDAASEESV
jgi:hypothetical protein